ncbi:threonyl-tRNA synthetase [Reticulomyxa filosa]|uniref:threonine--tRNA ligase n=1 Tax=Reticulomyxa filosa TaxID=46433 RepID=X6NQA9_RETFI|nr:threonyl-tRNA synthetase [Reticulomyxa filosa]|eukprot:ETO28211.1 threonyl-tRNA synthetase [Reticulomyxa filosa]
MFNFKLWETSGHAQNYAENMFLFDIEKQTFGLKPMNCPGHCLIFKNQLKSYRDLPVRYAGISYTHKYKYIYIYTYIYIYVYMYIYFGVLHRNELSGSLTGLTRLRKFQQDDAHIFCRRDQIETEVHECLRFLDHVYSKFGFSFELSLSTRPTEKFLGDVHIWDEAEQMLTKALNDFVQTHPSIRSWKISPGEGAFYGPKVDVNVLDSLSRQHQCATIQLDFQLPIRFDLQFKTESGESDRPVMIHRAIYGSFERFIAILCEHFGGKWPFWLSPRQICVVPVSSEFNDYAHKVKETIHKAGYWIDVDDSKNRLSKKIRNAQTDQYNFILVVGRNGIFFFSTPPPPPPSLLCTTFVVFGMSHVCFVLFCTLEQEANTVNVRRRDNTEHGTKSVDELLQWFKELTDNFQ